MLTQAVDKTLSMFKASSDLINVRLCMINAYTYENVKEKTVTDWSLFRKRVQEKSMGGRKKGRGRVDGKKVLMTVCHDNMKSNINDHESSTVPCIPRTIKSQAINKSITKQT